jgi:hypothetical protein
MRMKPQATPPSFQSPAPNMAPNVSGRPTRPRTNVAEGYVLPHKNCRVKILPSLNANTMRLAG